MSRPYFLITIDAEGDNLWSRPKIITTENAKFIPRFQTLVEQYGFKTTYLTNFEMANSREFQAFGRRVLRNESGEIGMHLHAWNSPPGFSLTLDDYHNMPYLTEYPEDIMRDKINFLTERLEDLFGVKMTSHRSGRWAFNETYAKILSEVGYLVDCSVTPHISWKKDIGDPNKFGGTCYYNFPETPYWLDSDDICQSDSKSLFLEVPLTVTYIDGMAASRLRGLFIEGSLVSRILNRIISSPTWLRPNGRNIKKMIKILEKAVYDRWPCVEFMLHSSELMASGSPTFPDFGSVEKLYNDLERLFEKASEHFRGATLNEFYNDLMNKQASR